MNEKCWLFIEIVFFLWSEFGGEFGEEIGFLGTWFRVNLIFDFFLYFFNLHFQNLHFQNSFKIK